MTLPAMGKKFAVAALTFIALGGVLSVSSLFAQKPAEEKPAAAAEKKARRALPAHYSGLVSEEQRAKIYAVQDKYESQIAALADQIKALQKQRESEIEAVLTAEQKKLLEKARADAKSKAEAKAAARKPAEK